MEDHRLKERGSAHGLVLQPCDLFRMAPRTSPYHFFDLFVMLHGLYRSQEKGGSDAKLAAAFSGDSVGAVCLQRASRTSKWLEHSRRSSTYMADSGFLVAFLHHI